VRTQPTTVLRWPPPLRCEACHQRTDVFASRVGWRCWNCLPATDRCDDRGQDLLEPEITSADRRALVAVRRQLAARRNRGNHRTNFQPTPAGQAIEARSGKSAIRGDRGSKSLIGAHPREAAE
jgi:hypothetical protein